MRISDWSSDVCSSDLIDADLVARNYFDMEYGRGVVLRIDAGEGRIAQDGGAQAIFGMQIRAANALIHDFLQAPVAFQAAILPPLPEAGVAADVLTDWSVSLAPPASFGQHLGNGC